MHFTFIEVEAFFLVRFHVIYYRCLNLFQVLIFEVVKCIVDHGNSNIVNTLPEKCSVSINSMD